jgi:uncharacterized membrane protein
MKLNKHWLMVLASAVGLASAFWQLMEKISLLKNPHHALSCNFNSTFNCSNVLNAHQSSALGPPNSVIGIIMFTFFLSIGLALATGSQISRRLALLVQGLAVFMLGFTLWFLFESTYRIHSVCLFCLFIGTSVLIINGVLKRHNWQNNPKYKRYFKSGLDIFFWAMLWLVVAFAMLLKFR